MGFYYKTGVDISSDKSMFNFIKNHFRYFTANYWNQTESIAANVKLYKLSLDGDWVWVLAHLNSGGYSTIEDMLFDFKVSHPGYEVHFNGRSNGYLVLTSSGGYRTAIPPSLDYDTYEEYKAATREDYGSVKANRDVLKEFVLTVRDFDMLCDDIRAFVNGLSVDAYEISEMQRIVDHFNLEYACDLAYLGFQPLSMNAGGTVCVSEIYQLQSLAEAFRKIADRSKQGYRLSFDSSYNNIARVKLEKQ